LLRVKEPKLLALKQQFSDNAPKAVFLGRFIALLRVFASPLAGIAEMPYPQFLFYNTVGAATWATVMVSLAYFAGQVVPLDQLVGYASKFGLVTFAIIVAWLVVPIWLESRKSEAIATEASEKQD